MGIAEQHKGYVLYDIQNRKVVYSRDVRFVPSGTTLADEIFPGETTKATPNSNTKSDSHQSTTSPAKITESPRKSTLTIKTPKRLIEEVNMIYSEELNANMDEPLRFKQVWKSRYRDQWITAMVTELNALTKNETWIRVPRPVDKNIISCKWVYKIKRKDDGSAPIFKARLVARGFDQEYLKDYFKTYSPVANKSSLRIFIIISSKLKLTINQYDVPAAYVKASLQGEEIHIDLPDGFRGRPTDIGNLTTPGDAPGTGIDPTEVLKSQAKWHVLEQGNPPKTSPPWFDSTTFR